MKKTTKLLLTAIVGIMIMTVSCKKDPIAPSVTTNDTKEIKATSAIAGGDVTADGEADISARGVCYSRSDANPNILTSSHTTDGTSTGTYESNITGLLNNTTYYYRAYATNEIGTSYGIVKEFKTLL